MKKVAIFGNAGGGKSTLSQRLADMTGLPWMPIDAMKYKPGGDEVPHAEFKAAHTARGLGAACWLAGEQPTVTRHTEQLLHRLAMPYQTDTQIPGLCGARKGDKTGLSFAMVLWTGL